ncbi:uncharacterized protein An03g04420 [Aspergillus niger]|uniref:Contig An03c0120, genomic contig n=2 Tax=Aspergillus niger TaxID=5061 RepID=A2QGT4_ASPNC|nr:uncharacterized protein An03g04420 [Aspergillus niger]CAK47881.1 unnamed protein product [Aspergillus niger]
MAIVRDRGERGTQGNNKVGGGGGGAPKGKRGEIKIGSARLRLPHSLLGSSLRSLRMLSLLSLVVHASIYLVGVSSCWIIS